MNRDRSFGSRGSMVALGILVLSAYLLTANGHIQTIDVDQTLQTARHMVADGELTVDTPFSLPGGSVRGVDGKAYSGHGIGMSLLFLPIAKLDDVIDRADDPALVPFLASLLNPVVGTLVVLLFYALERRLGVAAPQALAAALLLAFATLCWPYAHVSFDVVPTHAATLGAALCLLCWRDERAMRWVVGASACVAVAVLIRIDALLLAPILGVVVLWPALTSGASIGVRLRRAAPFAVAWTVPIAIALVVTGWFNDARFGSPFDSGHGGDPVTRLSTPIWTGVAGQLVSPGKGILWYSPVVVVAVLGWPTLIRRVGALAWGLLACVVATIGYHALLANWSGDEAWGPRYVIPVIGLLLLPLGLVLQRWRELLPHWRAAILVTAGISVGVQLLGVGVDYLAVKRDTVHGDVQYWSLGASPLVSNAKALGRSVRGADPYPGRAEGGITADPVPAFDFWWLANTYGKHRDFERAVPVLALTLLGSGMYLVYDTRRRRGAEPSV